MRLSQAAACAAGRARGTPFHASSIPVPTRELCYRILCVCGLCYYSERHFKADPERAKRLELPSGISKCFLMKEVSLVNYSVSCERFSHVLPLGWTSSLLRSLINCILCLEEGSPLLLFPGVNEMRRKVTLSPTRLFSHFGWSSALTSPLYLCFRGACSLPGLIQASSGAGSTPAAPLFALLYLHTQQTGNCVHLYANVFVPKAEVLN